MHSSFDGHLDYLQFETITKLLQIFVFLSLYIHILSYLLGKLLTDGKLGADEVLCFRLPPNFSKLVVLVNISSSCV